MGSLDANIKVGGCEVGFVDVVRGLKAEAARVEEAFSEMKPGVLAMSVSPEEVQGLRSFSKEPFEVEMSRYEELYSLKLSAFGDVFIPPPCFLAAIEISEKSGVKLESLDMDDEAHSTAYCALVSSSDLFRHSTRLKLLQLRQFKASDPKDFAKEWDQRVNNLKGFRQLELEREKFMARRVKDLTSTETKILAVIDAERAGGVREILLADLKE